MYRYILSRNICKRFSSIFVASIVVLFDFIITITIKYV